VALKHRGRGCYKKDPQAPWVVGIKGQTAAQGQCTAKDSRILYRLHGSPTSGVW